MKILYPIYAFYPNHAGGPAMAVYWMAKALVSQGVDVDVVTSTDGLDGLYKENTWVTVDGIRVRYCSGNKIISQGKVFWYSLCNISNCDILHLESFCYPPSLALALIIGFFSRKKIFWSPRGEISSHFLEKSLAKRLIFKIYGFLFRGRIIFHGTSDEESDDLRKVIGNCTIVQLPNYIELPPKIHTHQENYLVFLGRINHVKALDKLIIALHESNGFMNSDMRLLIAGKATIPEEVEFQSMLHSLIEKFAMKNRVIFLGEVGGESKDNLLAQARYSFLVSESENFGNVVIEAMSQGTPVITSLGTPWGILSENGVGFHVSNDIETLSKTIDNALAIPESDYLKMRERVYDFCSKEYNVENNVWRWIEVYE